MNSIINEIHSCPLINGEAVFGARNLLSSIKGEKFYNDKVICASQGYAYKTRQEKEKKSDF